MQLIHYILNRFSKILSSYSSSSESCIISIFSQFLRWYALQTVSTTRTLFSTAWVFRWCLAIASDDIEQFVRCSLIGRQWQKFPTDHFSTPVLRVSKFVICLQFQIHLNFEFWHISFDSWKSFCSFGPHNNTSHQIIPEVDKPEEQISIRC